MRVLDRQTVMESGRQMMVVLTKANSVVKRRNSNHKGQALYHTCSTQPVIRGASAFGASLGLVSPEQLTREAQFEAGIHQTTSRVLK